MKHKISAAAILLAAMLLPLGSCRKPTQYTDTLTAAELAADARAALDQTEFFPAEKGYLNDYFPIPEELTDYEIDLAADGNNLSEFGIWHTGNGAESISILLRGYLEESFDRNRSFYDSYIPQETPKLRDAEVRVYGNYVAYAILNDTDRKTFFQTIENNLLAQ